MTAPFLSPGLRITDSDDNPLAGGYINFYAAGTTTPKAVYSDADLSTSLGTTVDLNSAGAPVSGGNTPVLIYPGLGDYKIRYYDADDTLIFEFDDYPGGVAAVEESTTGLPVIPVDSKTTAYTVVEGDRGNLINANPTGGAFAITLPSAVTVGDDFMVGFRHNGTANQVYIVSTGGQSIRGRKNVTSHVLGNQGDIAWLISDGSDWIVAGSEKQAPPFHVVIDSLTAPPVSPIPGAKYRINGTPTGAWSSFADEDIAEADGNGSWIRHTPASGWLVFDQDTEEYLKFTDGAWGSLLVAPAASTLKTIVAQDQKSSGTVGGAAVVATWTTAVLNTSVVNTITSSSLAANTITLPAGRYRVHGHKVFVVTEGSQIRFKTSADDSIIIRGLVVKAGESNDSGNNNFHARTSATSTLMGEFEISESTDFILQYYVEKDSSQSNTALGYPASIASTNEVYATVVIEDIAAQQGPQGPQGASGNGSGDFVIASNDSDDITEGAANLFLTVAERAAIDAQWTTVMKTADQTVQSNTTLFVDNTLVFPMSGNTNYSIRLRVYVDTGATGDFKFRHVGPASPTLVRIKRAFIIGAGTAYTLAMDTAYSASDVAVAGAAGMAYVEFDGFIKNGANSGNFEFWWAQNASEAVDTTVRLGSYIEYKVVA
jgi:hypothetical protein